MWECNCATLSIWSSKDAPLGCSVVQEAFQGSSARHMSSHPLITYLHTPVNTIFITCWACFHPLQTFAWVEFQHLHKRITTDEESVTIDRITIRFEWHEERKKIVRVSHCNPCWTEHRPGWKLLSNVHRDYPFIYCSVTPSAGQSLLLFVSPIKCQTSQWFMGTKMFCRLFIFLLHHAHQNITPPCFCRSNNSTFSIIFNSEKQSNQVNI